MLSIGLMSGTSMDGIDAALLETDGSPQLVKELGDISIPYAAPFKILLKAAEFSVHRCSGDMKAAETYYEQGLREYLKEELRINDADISKQIATLSNYLPNIRLSTIIQHSTDLHSLAVKRLLAKTRYTASQISVVGYHGQTLFHQPQKKISIIVGNGQQLADRVAIPVVNDFRSRDIAAGGQGAPFAPLYHYALAIRDRKIPVAIVNCGGIANITLVNSASESDLIAFDTGPGNGLIDRLIKQRTQGKESMDTDGKYGNQGRIHPEVLTALHQHSIIRNKQNYFSLPPPKSLDIGDMCLIAEIKSLSLTDACATLEAFTADTIVQSLELVSADTPSHWILAGGGCHNPVIRRELTERLQKRLKTKPQVQTADEAGWNSRTMEAQIFAYLAVRSLQGKPLSLPRTTQVPYPLSGGSSYFPSA